MKKIILLSALILSFVSCNKRQFLKDENLPIFITIQFRECGEWGGHREGLKIYKIEKKYFLDLKKYNSPCGQYSSEPIFPQKVIASKSKILLGEEDKNILDIYLNNLADQKEKTFPISNGPVTIEISRTNKSDILIYGDEKLTNEYSSVLNKIVVN